jgi:Holliday junction resolvase RusA-like endonuclease
MIEFWIKGEPKAQPRPKAYRRGSKIGIYTPKTADAWKRCVKQGVEFWTSDQDPIDHPCQVVLEFFMPRIQSHFRKQNKLPVLKDDAPMVHSSKPDIDNLEKSTIDALVDAGVFKDDNIIWHLDTYKRYSRHDLVGCRITITQ